MKIRMGNLIWVRLKYGGFILKLDYSCRATLTYRGTLPKSDLIMGLWYDSKIINTT